MTKQMGEFRADKQDEVTAKSTHTTKSLSAVPSKRPFLTSWCGGMGCDNCKACLIFSGKAILIKADDVSHKLTYRIVEPYGGK